MNTYGIPSVTIEQMREVDRIMVEEIGVSIVMMMENASRNIAILARRILGRTIKDKSVIILCGKGNNGGDGLGAARHLLNYGAECHIILAARPSELRADPKIQYQILQKSYPQSLEININNKNEYLKHCGSADLIIDALLGYNLKGNPKEPIA
ncbi:NAD(P)H-hydrate epimerase, partial [Candidatus Gottesmanbacteria bacterium]|nr:NAD(P)H-hydrate epimerase [Candidatus Gottesmanbacteria bacterium]